MDVRAFGSWSMDIRAKELYVPALRAMGPGGCKCGFVLLLKGHFRDISVCMWLEPYLKAFGLF